ncbi:hypothetical protein GBA65_13895 [Rubrobacter marinus]|uniref:Uncharacterized protein n=1 Tax=Rubrobacter marinus TaxID=2653852 RepID=A0A6G8PZ03_9ACTN|nr:hypothetical protein GBA65_13895 [Rubrobacter marinus]
MFPSLPPPPPPPPPPCSPPPPPPPPQPATTSSAATTVAGSSKRGLRIHAFSKSRSFPYATRSNESTPQALGSGFDCLPHPVTRRGRQLLPPVGSIRAPSTATQQRGEEASRRPSRTPLTGTSRGRPANARALGKSYLGQFSRVQAPVRAEATSPRGGPGGSPRRRRR